MNRQQILEEAIKCVTKDRNATHGEPEDNFLIIAKYWRNYLNSIYPNEQILISPVDVAAMMALMKISRLATSPKHLDHWIDVAGYAACGGGIASEGVAGSEVNKHPAQGVVEEILGNVVGSRRTATEATQVAKDREHGSEVANLQSKRLRTISICPIQQRFDVNTFQLGELNNCCYNCDRPENEHLHCKVELISNESQNSQK